jgi:D-lactate dehydrogenase (cytochrome)
MDSQVAGFLQEMNARKITVTISGARTGIVGGAIPFGGALMSLERMNKIVGIRWDHQTSEWRVTVEPGIILKEFQERIAKRDLGNDGGGSPDSNWKDLQRFIGETQSYFYPPDPTEGSASLGGTVATDASGSRTYYFGRTRNHVRAIRIALARGDVLEIRRGEHIVDASRILRIRRLDGRDEVVQLPSYESPHVKTAAGYRSLQNMDLIDLFIGSEGTLGVITLIEVALTAAPKHTAMFLAFFPSEDDALSFVLRVRSTKTADEMKVHSLEYFDPNSIDLLERMKQDGKLNIGIKLPYQKSTAAILSEFSYEDLPEAIQLLQTPLDQSHSSLDNAVSGIDEQGKEQLRVLRHAIPEAINKIVAQRKLQIPGMHKIGTDSAVPDDKLESLMKPYSDLLRKSNLEYYVFGHIAENHLHINLIPRNVEELAKAETLALELARHAVSLGGTVSAEHGIGKMKRHLLKMMFSDAAISQMVMTKRALDPNEILCPGNMFLDETLLKTPQR